MTSFAKKIASTAVLTAALTGTFASTSWAQDIAPAPQPTQPSGPGNIAPAPQPTNPPKGPADIAPAPKPTNPPKGPGDIAPAPKPTNPPKGPGDLAPAPKPTDPGVPDDKVSNGGGGGGTQPTGPDDLANPTHGCQTTHGCVVDEPTDGGAGGGSEDGVEAADAAQPVATDDSSLPFTGDSTLLYAEIGGGLVALGLMSLVAARRRRSC